MSENTDIRDIFFQETGEILEQLEQDILILEDSSQIKEIINKIFRGAHTIKGSAAFMMFTGMSSFAHSMENVFDLIRKEELQADSNLVNALLKGVDILKKMLDNPEEYTEEILKSNAEISSTLNEINKYIPRLNSGPKNLSKIQVDEKYYKLMLNFNKDVFETGIDPLILIEELSTKGEMVGYDVNIGELPDIYAIDPYVLYIKWIILIKTKYPKKEIEDVFVFLSDDNDIQIDEVDIKEIDVEEKKLGEILVAKGIIQDSDIEKALSNQPKLGEILIKEGKVSSLQVEKIVSQQQEARTVKESTSIRVDTQKLDKLMNLVGELVINQARVAQLSSKKGNLNLLELSSTAETLDRITREIQEQIMRARMIPIESTFNQFQRLVRDTSSEKGKDIKLNILGKKTELDKTIIELIGDPLKHMIRNSIDHGLETREERLNIGKNESGTITLNAYHESGNIVIEVVDDGRGLNKEKILTKAREKGLVQGDRELSNDEIYQLIFLPGFSTVDQVSEISGRGVGMDVVKNNITKLRGSVEIHTKEGEGTTFKIILPLTLAIIDGMLVKVGEELYVIPLLSIVESIRPKASEVQHVNVESEVVSVRGEYIPLIRLYELFSVKTDYTDPSKALVVIVNVGKNKACLLVDDIIGQQQAVIKSLEENYKAMKGISGATILGDGMVAMILDVPAIIKMVTNN